MNKRLKFIALFCMIITIVCVLLSSNAFATDFDIDEKSSTKITELTNSSQKPTTTSTTKPTTKPSTTTTTTKPTTKATTKSKVLKSYSSTKNLSLKKGEPKKLTVGFSGNLLYNVGDSKIVIVSQDGTVYGLKAGTTYVQVHNDKYVQNFQITVKDGETTTAESESETTTEPETIEIIGDITKESTTLEIDEEIPADFDSVSSRTMKLTIILSSILAVTIIALIAVLIYNKISNPREEDSLIFDDAVSEDFNPDIVDENDFYEFQEPNISFEESELDDDDLTDFENDDTAFNNMNDPFLK